MSIVVKQRVAELGIETTHEERIALDNIIEEMTHVYCDEGVKQLTDAEVREAVRVAKERAKKKQQEDELLTNGEQAERLLTEGIA